MAKPQTSLAALAPLMAVMLVAMTGFGVFLPIFPFLALSTGASATALTWSLGAYSLGQVIAAPLWGRLSDRIGRKPVLILGLLGTALSYLLLAQAHTILEMGAVRLAGGLMAGNAGAAFAAAADLADDRTRARNMGMLGASVGFGFIAGPALGALIAGTTPARIDFERICLVSALFAFAAAAAALFFFRETKREARGQTPRHSAWALLRLRPALAGVALASLLMLTAQALLESTFGLWTHLRFAWGPREVGWTLAALGLAGALLQGGGAGAASRLLGDRGAMRLGLAALACGFALAAWSESHVLLFVALAFIALGAGLAAPALQSIAAASVPEAEHGAAMGLTQSAGALGRVIGPAMGGALLEHGGDAAPYAVAALLALLALTPGFMRFFARDPSRSHS